jgi:hypothetical protein
MIVAYFGRGGFFIVVSLVMQKNKSKKDEEGRKSCLFA